MTYGALVTTILRDNNNDCEVCNRLLNRMGHNIGIRLVEEYLARTGGVFEASRGSKPHTPLNNTHNPNQGTDSNSSHNSNNNGNSINNSNSGSTFGDGAGQPPPPPQPDVDLFKGGGGVCQNIQETAESIAKIGFKMFLGINVDVTNYTNNSFSLYMYQNPFALFVELPANLVAEGLSYTEILCGVLRGCLAQVGLVSKVTMVRDCLRGDEVNELKVVISGQAGNEVGDDFKDE